MPQVYPRILFRLDENLDKWTGVNFLHHQRGGLDFGTNILRYHPTLSLARKLDNKQKQKFIFAYVDNFYKNYFEELKKTKNVFQIQWDKKSKDFFMEVGKIFNYYPWPGGKYIAYLSIFPCGPRFLKDKTFQVFYLTKQGAPLSIAHEILHFLFYDYFEKIFPKINSRGNKVWVLSEIINILILESPSFCAIFDDSRLHGYPEHASLIENLQPMWEKKKDLNSFLKYSLKIIGKEGLANSS